MNRPARIALLAGAVALTAYGAMILMLRMEPGPGGVQLEDINRLKQMVLFLLDPKTVPPTRGGQLDPYSVLPREFAVELCTSARGGGGPTREEIEAGNYRNFPYARIATPFDPKDAHETAVLWDGSPQANGKRLVALDSGAVRLIPESEFAAFLEAHSR